MKDSGYWIENDVIPGSECDVILNALSQNENGRGRAGTRHLMSNRIVAALANDDRLSSLAQRSLGTGAVPFRATLFQKSSKANWLVYWHQDTALPLVAYAKSNEWGPWSQKEGILYAHAPSWALARIVALRLHLDDSTKENGSLRIIPGSHQAGVLSDEEVFSVARRSTHVECEVRRGGVLAMRPLLIHSSSKARSDRSRRVLHIEYADSLNLNDVAQLAIA
jgi:ectoine hydroxylase-related dioxygenase (phytanoyl-CoA dioxygenase family)